MKKIILYIYLATLSLSAFAQVGINTITPRKTLEVSGNTKISGTLKIGTIDALVDGDNYDFVTQETNGDVDEVDLTNTQLGNALGYIQTYEIQNVELDWLDEFNTLVNSNKFTVIVTSFSFSEEVGFVFSTVGDFEGFSIPAVSSFVKNGTWWVKADYPQIDSVDGSTNGTWTISVLIISKDLIKTFNDQVYNMNNSTTGAAVSPLID